MTYLSDVCFPLAALVWQLMKAYTLSILTKLAGQEGEHPMVDKEVVAWANEKVRRAFKVTTKNICAFVTTRIKLPCYRNNISTIE